MAFLKTAKERICDELGLDWGLPVKAVVGEANKQLGLEGRVP